MINSYFQQPQKSSWIKWAIIIALLAMLALLTYVMILYTNIQQDKQAGFSETEKIVLRDTDLVEVTDMMRYHGEFAYHIVFGVTEDNQEKIVFVPITKEDQDLVSVDQTEIISKQTLEKQLQNECDTCKIISIIPGIEDDELLWELTYVDDSNRYVLEYVSIYDATQYEQFRFKRLYK
ncbi:MAG TPA: DUF5590 domain-containing protein [Candidatus Dormibacteraeota bacterium]|nr:DUF5590 domain-containing protein [Candidatus Dormibacteraeota bacterium]